MQANAAALAANFAYRGRSAHRASCCSVLRAIGARVASSFRDAPSIAMRATSTAALPVLRLPAASAKARAAAAAPAAAARAARACPVPVPRAVQPVRCSAPRGMSTRVAAATADVYSSPADNDFATYVPKVAFLFPGQGAQTVGMAKASAGPPRAMRRSARRPHAATQPATAQPGAGLMAVLAAQPAGLSPCALLTPRPLGAGG